MKRYRLSEETARELVEVGTVPKYVSVQEIEEPPFDCEPLPASLELRLARLQTRWYRNEQGLYQATACFLDDKNAVDLSTEFDVYAPLAHGDPDGTPRWEKFYVVYRNDRWESIQTLPTIPKYKSGDHMAIYLDGVGPDYIVDNAGLTHANTVDQYGYDVGPTLRGRLAFDDKRFEIVNISDAVKGLTVKYAVKRVVTDVAFDNDGRLNVTKEWIAAIE